MIVVTEIIVEISEGADAKGSGKKTLNAQLLVVSQTATINAVFLLFTMSLAQRKIKRMPL